MMSVERHPRMSQDASAPDRILRHIIQNASRRPALG
jgi:hypothetical protein